MRVRPDPVPGEPIVRLVATETDREAHIHVGDQLGYRCTECEQADEDVSEIVHRESCPLAGRHGRLFYGDGVPDASPAGELDPRNTLTEVTWATTDDALGIHNGATVAWLCDECGNLDEHAFEIVHETHCSLAGVVESVVG